MVKTHLAVILSQMLDAWTEGIVEDVDSFIESYCDEILEELKVYG